MKEEIKIFESESWEDYELLDTGEGEKLERVGKYKFIRPCEDAFWNKSLPKKEWEEYSAKFITSKEGGKGGWRIKEKIEPSWIIEYKNIKWKASPTPFRHFGFFPEQKNHWDFIYEKISKANRSVKFLNLFGYTGVASLFALKAGAEVTHVDASKQSIDWAKENEKLNLDIRCPSGHPMSTMRVIIDDVLKFLEREGKRGNKYDAVIMDPPKFGRGPKGEIWKIEDNMMKLLSQVKKILSSEPIFVILNSYATNSSSLSLGYSLEESFKDLNGKVEKGELCLKEKSGKLISLSNTAIWTPN